jgi:hypothetical protein
MKKNAVEENIGNCTFYPMSGDDLLKLCSSKDYKFPPKDDLHSKLGKQGLQ